MCHIPNGFRYLARNIFLPSLSMSNHNSQLMLHTDSHASDMVHYGGDVFLATSFLISSSAEVFYIIFKPSYGTP
jgi:hypothetical protein